MRELQGPALPVNDGPAGLPQFPGLPGASAFPRHRAVISSAADTVITANLAPGPFSITHLAQGLLELPWGLARPIALPAALVAQGPESEPSGTAVRSQTMAGALPTGHLPCSPPAHK